MGHKMFSAFEQNGMRIERFWKHETADVGEVVVKWWSGEVVKWWSGEVVKWLKQHKSANLVLSGPLLMTTFVLTNLNGNLQLLKINF